GPSPEPVDPQGEDDAQGFQGLTLVNLRSARAAVLESDWRLAHPAADLPAPEEDLFLERIPPRPDSFQVDLGQLRHPITAERAAIVAGLQPEQEAGVPVDP